MSPIRSLSPVSPLLAALVVGGCTNAEVRDAPAEAPEKRMELHVPPAAEPAPSVPARSALSAEAERSPEPKSARADAPSPDERTDAATAVPADAEALRSLGYLSGGTMARKEDGLPSESSRGYGRTGLGSGGRGRISVAPHASMPAPVVRPGPSWQPAPDAGADDYAHVEENGFLAATQHPLSTFSVDVDSASYTNSRRFLDEGRLPPADAVRIEEFVNAFRYSYPDPTGGQPFAVSAEVASCPWNAGNRLVRLGIQADRMDDRPLPPRNLVFLVDVSGSMNAPDRLPLVKHGLKTLVDQLTERDHVAIVVYAGAAGLVLPPTPGSRPGQVLDALERLQAGGSTAGGAGIRLAYDVARRSFRKDAINRVVLVTDGDFNVGMTGDGELTRLIEQERESGVFLTVFGFGRGNLKDSRMEMLADKGNGHYAYIDSVAEARKAFGREAGAALVTLAKDVKIQVEWNPALVQGYRLVGYENRVLAARDFNDDRKDAGEIGAGHSVTALYEVVPAGSPLPGESVDALRYQRAPALSPAASSGELLTVKLRYKEPQGQQSRLLAFPLRDDGRSFTRATADTRFAASVAAFGMLLKDSAHRGTASFAQVQDWAAAALGDDRGGERREFLGLVERARALKGDEVAGRIAR